MAAALAYFDETESPQHFADLEPQSTRSLPNKHLDLSDENITHQSLFDFRRRRAFEKKFKSLTKIIIGILDRVTLAGNIQLGTKGHEAIAFGLNDCGQLPGHRLPGHRFGPASIVSSAKKYEYLCIFQHWECHTFEKWSTRSSAG